MGVCLGEDEGLGNLVVSIFIKTIWEDGGEHVSEGLDDGADLGGVDDVAIELLGGICLVLVLLFPAFLTGEFFTFLGEALDDGAALLGDFCFYEVDFIFYIDSIGYGFLVSVF